MDSTPVRIAVIAGAGLAVLVIGFLIGLAVGGDSGEADAAVTTTSTTTAPGTSSDAPEDTGSPTTVVADGGSLIISEPVPEFGTDEERQALLDALAESGVGFGSASVTLALADRTCYDLERLRAQNRPVSFAVRVVWNESLAEAESTELAAFGAVFTAAPFFLCPESVDYAQDVAYWLGI